MLRRRAIRAALTVAAVLVLAACAAGANTVAQAQHPDAAGFWLAWIPTLGGSVNTAVAGWSAE